MERIVVVDDLAENLVAARQAAETFTQFVWVFCSTMTEALKEIAAGCAGVVTDCFFPWEEGEETRILYLSYLLGEGRRGTLGESIFFLPSEWCSTYLDNKKEKVQMLWKGQQAAYGAALLLRRANYCVTTLFQETEPPAPTVLVTDLHRHACDNKDDGLYNGAIVLAPMYRDDMLVDGIISAEDIESDGSNGCPYFMGHYAIQEAGGDLGKASPLVWAEAYRRLLQQMEG